MNTRPAVHTLRNGLPLAAAIAVLFHTGCGSAGEGPSLLHRAATEQNRVGQEAYLTGRAGDAVVALRESVRLHLAAGDLPGAARALLNQALAERGAGNVEAAAATSLRLDELTPAARQQLEEQGDAGGAIRELLCANSWLQALLALGRGDAAAAAGLLPSEAGLPAVSPWPARLKTLRAEIDLASGHFAEAAAAAAEGIKASVAAKDPAEEARGWRLAGAAHLKLDRWPEARGDFLAAVKIEEALGGGARMAGDLAQLAIIAEHLGDGEAARLYSHRATTILAARTR